MSSPNITLYTAATPNGHKISIALEELGIPYELRELDMKKNEQKESWFVDKINLNGRIPAITDKSFKDGKELSIMESGAILEYLAETYDTEHKISYPRGTREYWEQQQWLHFQMSGVGPMQGQAAHFMVFAPEKIPYGITRYQDESKRLFGVLNKRLANNGTGYLVGDHICIADIALIGWVAMSHFIGIELSEYPELKKWVEFISSRPAVEKGRNSPARKA